MWHSSDGVGWILFFSLFFFFFNLAALFNSSPPNAPGGNGRRRRNAHNGVKWKLAAAAEEEEENRPVLRNIHRFQGCRVVVFFFFCHYLLILFFPCSSGVLVCNVHAFLGGFDMRPAVEGGRKTIFWGRGFRRDFSFSPSFFFVAFTGRGGGSGRLIERISSPLKVSFIFVNQNGFYCFHWRVCGCTFFFFFFFF